MLYVAISRGAEIGIRRYFRGKPPHQRLHEPAFFRLYTTVVEALVYAMLTSFRFTSCEMLLRRRDEECNEEDVLALILERAAIRGVSEFMASSNLLEFAEDELNALAKEIVVECIAEIKEFFGFENGRDK